MGGGPTGQAGPAAAFVVSTPNHPSLCGQATLDRLADWERKGRVTQTDFSLAPQPHVRDGYLAFGTDKICLVEKKTLVCGQAALVHMTSHSLVELGIKARPVPGECMCISLCDVACLVCQLISVPGCLPQTRCL